MINYNKAIQRNKSHCSMRGKRNQLTLEVYINRWMVNNCNNMNKDFYRARNKNNKCVIERK